jgi:RNA polymerase sigma-70 factor, ECF subfamily
MSEVSLSPPSYKAVGADFEEIYRHHAPMVYRTAKGVLGKVEDAEDVLQIVFLRLLRRELTPDILQNIGAYLYRAAVNSSLDLIQARRRHVQAGDREHLAGLVSVSDSDLEEELHKRLFEGIAQLDARNAEIVILRYVHNMSDAEIARMLGMSRGAVAVRLLRSRARLKKLLRATLGGKA